MRAFDNHEAFKVLHKKAQEWGGNILPIEKKDVESIGRGVESIGRGVTTYKGHRIYPCPFNEYLWVVWHSKTILYDPPEHSFPRRFHGAPETIRWGDLLHEMAHVFASKVQPNRSLEQDFLGWEYHMAKNVFEESPEKAIKAFEAQMEKKGFQEKNFFNVFVAKKMDRNAAPMANSKFGYDSVEHVSFQGWTRVGPHGWRLPSPR